MQIHSIAVGTDFSRDSERAIAQALAIAEASGAEVHLIHMVGPLEPPPAPAGARDRYARRMQEHLEHAKSEIARLGEHHAAGGTTITQHVVDGQPAFGLVQTAREIGAELLIVGSHGRTGARRLLLGSVSEKAVRLAQMDVMVARERPSGQRGFHKILVPTDFSPTAERSLEAARDLVATSGEVQVAHYWSPPGDNLRFPFAASDSDDERDEIAGEARAKGRELVERHGSGRAEIAFFHRCDTPGRGIVSTLDGAGDYDLVVMGSHGHRGIERWLLGSTTGQVVRHAPCSVYVVKSDGS